jgi:translation initiation factor IF-1
MLAKKTSKNQITLPKKIVKELPHTDYFDVSFRDGAVVLRPVTMMDQNTRLETIRGKIRKLGLKREDIDNAIEWARSSRAVGRRK